MIEEIINRVERKRLLGAALLADGLINQQQLDQALERQQQTGAFLGETLIELGHVMPSILGKYVEERINYPFVEITGTEIDFETARSIPERIARRKIVLPFALDETGVHVAMADPLDLGTVDELKSFFSKPVIPHLAFASDITEGINRAFDVRHKSMSALRDIEDVGPSQLDLSVDELVGMAEDAPIVRLVNGIVQGALAVGASDIHIEPMEREVRVRYRLDGLLYDQTSWPKPHLAAVVSRIKIMSRLNIAERRRPQDGRFTTRDDKAREFDLRVSIMPAIYGEKVVMRVLEKASTFSAIEKLGFFPDQQAQYERLIASQHGIVLVTGPTGSGKSTTLYSALQKINSPTLNINTIEDPVEYHLSGITQTQANPKIGLTFASGLRTLVRQDPDVIMVGEIRDGETAEIAIQAALTGHLVLSTLHTNDAPGSLVRLQNMGVEPFLISSAVLGVIGQRLVRTVCPSCRELIPAELADRAALDLDEDVTIARGAGCGRCGNRGMKGRTAVYEIMSMSDTLRDMVLRRAAGSELKDQAVAEGMQSMRVSGRQRVIEHVTTPDEVLRVLYTDD